MMIEKGHNRGRRGLQAHLAIEAEVHLELVVLLSPLSPRGRPIRSIFPLALLRFRGRSRSRSLSSQGLERRRRNRRFSRLGGQSKRNPAVLYALFVGLDVADLAAVGAFAQRALFRSGRRGGGGGGAGGAGGGGVEGRFGDGEFAFGFFAAVAPVGVAFEAREFHLETEYALVWGLEGWVVELGRADARLTVCEPRRPSLRCR